MVGSSKLLSKERSRSPSFTRDEVLLLIKLVEKYRLIVLNKSTNADANHAKDVAWLKIAREFNNAGLGYKRHADTLKGKWENLKRNVKKTSNNLIDTRIYDMSKINTQVIALMSAADNIGNIDNPQELLEETSEDNDMIENGAGSDASNNIESDTGADDQIEKATRNRSQNFSPPETKLLLECVRKEKEHVFTKEITSRAIEIKNRAWSRIADSYNVLSSQKRSAKCLRNKFMSMKKLARKLGTKELMRNVGVKQRKHEILINDSFKNIKKEPFCDNENIDDDSDQYSNHDDNEISDPQENQFRELPDPLRSVLNGGDSGLGSSSSQMSGWNCCQSDNKEIIKLKMELLNYEMETAKLERKRVEEALLEDARERESRALERALRVRAARLEAEAAGARLPPHHPARALAPPEERAQPVLAHYSHT